MIVLILGWHFAFVGFLALILGLMASCVPCLIFGLGTFVVGVVTSVILRNTCSTRPSNATAKPAVEAPLEYY